MSTAIPTRLTFIRKSDRKGYGVYRCSCPARTVKEIRVVYVESGTTVSCGCYQKERAREANTKHGGYKDKLYRCWMTMRARCENKDDCNYPSYGGRGITVCERWQDYTNYAADIGVRPSPKHSIDRVRNDDGYWCGKTECPDCGPAGRKPNWRWATAKEQQRNKRSNHLITYQGKTQCLRDWATEFGLKKGTLLARIQKGRSIEEALNTPSTYTYRKRRRL